MRAFLMTTVAVVCMAPVAAQDQERSEQPPVAAGESTTVSAGQSAGASADVDPTAQAAGSTGLGDIVVTAQRKSESAQRAAVAIDVIGGADLIGAGATTTARLGSLVPALTIQTVGPSNIIFIRGVGNFTVQVTGDPAVAFNYDGVYVGRPSSTTGTFFDLDRIEVLKGPQGTLYGRNATGGAINVLPTQPKIGQLSGYGTLSYGNYNALVAEGAVNVPLGDKGALRVSGTITNRDGYLADGTSDDKTHAVRVQLKAKLTPALTVRVSGDYSHNGGNGPGLSYLNTYAYNATTGQFVVRPTGLTIADGAHLPAAQAFFQTLPTLTAKRNLDPFPNLYQNNNFYGANADIVYDTGGGILTIIPAVRFDRLDYISAGGGFPTKTLQNDIQYSVETRFSGKVSLFDYTVGTFYYNEHNLSTGGTSLGASENFALGTTVNTQSYAPFGRLTANLSSRLRLVGGIRYTHDAKQFNASNVALAIICVAAACPNVPLLPAVVSPFSVPFAIPAASGLTVASNPPGAIITRTDTFFNIREKKGKITYRGAVEFDVAPASLLYASVETGYRSGGFNTSIGYETYAPEYITAFTLGSKNRFFDNRLQLNIEGFYWKYRDQQVSHAGVDLAGRIGNFTQNIGKSTIKGVEIEARVLATRHTVLSADVQYLDARNDAFTYQVNRTPVPTYTNCRVSPSSLVQNGIALNDVNCAGLPAYNSPKWTLNLGAEQTVPLGDYKAVLGADTQFKTKRYTYFDYQPGQLQRSSWTTNLQVSFGPANDRWSVSGFIRNIENDRLLVAAIANPFANLLSAYTSPPRTYGGRVSVKF